MAGKEVPVDLEVTLEPALPTPTPLHELLGMTEDTYENAAGLKQAYAYLEEHHLPRLMENLLARAALERPPDLRDFLIESLTELKKSKGQPSLGIFTSEDLETMFDMWDQLKTGKIPASKLAETLKALNCCPAKEEEAVERLLGSASSGDIDKATFVKAVTSELERCQTSINP
eukprot:TRINITY_DN94059_c0_g1_i1.p1 TRINITY_DN94059_c0_g1~~TRINITY_DN94059_c0_g1_i1.p1  ORF type:complete len:173 (+),score=31.03 TRINITY_DN94059_c0_g1_i1:83-601(+)